MSASTINPRSHRRKTGLLWGLALLVALFSVMDGRACNVPVFRYALEKWVPGRYEVFVFHKGELTAEQKAALKLLDDMADADPVRVNLKLEVVDLSGKPDPDFVELYQSLKTTDTPVMTVLFPALSGINTPFWTGPLTSANVQALLDSPARRKIAEDILKGTSAVWVILKSGDAKKDKSAIEFVRAELKKLEKTLELPELTQDPEDKLDSKAIPLKLSFSILEVDRNDPAEAIFVQMLLECEPEEEGLPHLRTYQEPMVFPVFGRGRGMFPLVGAGINDDNVIETAQFLVGPCSCKVKEQNPGFDLLMSVAWTSIIADRPEQPYELPPLVGITKLAPSAGSSPGADKTETEPVPADEPTEDPDAKTSPNYSEGPSISAAPPTDSPTETGTSEQQDAGLVRNSLLAVAAGIGIVALVYLGTRFRSSRE